MLQVRRKCEGKAVLSLRPKRFSMKHELQHITALGVLTNETLEAARLVEVHAIRHDPDVAKRSVQLLPEDLLEDVRQASGEDQHGDAL